MHKEYPIAIQSELDFIVSAAFIEHDRLGFPDWNYFSSALVFSEKETQAFTHRLTTPDPEGSFYV